MNIYKKKKAMDYNRAIVTSIRNREKLYNKLRKQPFNTILQKIYSLAKCIK